MAVLQLMTLPAGFDNCRAWSRQDLEMIGRVGGIVAYMGGGFAPGSKWTPIVVGVGIAAGSGILAILWFTRGVVWTAPPAALPGLPHYPSAYLGDSLLLPIAGGLLLAGARLLPATRGERAIVLGAGTLAAVAAGTVQVLWLADQHPTGNWTFPGPHHFNVAGNWHALYFVAVSTTLAIVAALLSRRLAAALRSPARERAESLMRGAGPSVVLSCLMAYAVLAVHDSSAGTLASRTSLISIAVVAILVFVAAGLILGRSRRLLGQHLLIAVIAALAVIFMVDTHWSDDRTHLLGVLGSTMAGAALALLTLVRGRDMRHQSRFEDDRPSAAHVLLIGAILVVLLPSLWERSASGVDHSRWVEASAWFAAFCLAVVAVPALIIRRHREQWLRQASDVSLIFALLGLTDLAALTISRWQDSSDATPFASIAVGAAITALFFPILKIRMHSAIRDEQSRVTDGPVGLTGELKVSATATIGMLLMSGVSAAISLLAFTLAAAIGRMYVADAGALPGFGILVGSGSTLIILGLVVASIRAPTLQPFRRHLAPVLVLGWSIALVHTGFHGVPPITVASTGGGVVLGLWAANTMIHNVGVLRGDRADAVLWTTACAVALSGFLTGFFATSAALAESPSHVYSWGGGLLAAAAALVINGGLGVVVGCLVAGRGDGKTRHALGHNLVQDASLMALLYLIALVAPASTLLHLSPNLGFWARFWATSAIVAPFMAYFIGAFKWQLDTNLGHVQREIASRAEDPEATRAIVEGEHGVVRRNAVTLRASRGSLGGPPQQQFLRTLNAHVRNQNNIATATVLVSLLGAFVFLGAAVRPAFAYLQREDILDPRS